MDACKFLAEKFLRQLYACPHNYAVSSQSVAISYFREYETSKPNIKALPVILF